MPSSRRLLFLGAGSVIHAMSDEQDMRNMGGICSRSRDLSPDVDRQPRWRCSVSPYRFAGFYLQRHDPRSRLRRAYRRWDFAFWMGIAAAVMTAFYSWRLLFMTFHGKPVPMSNDGAMCMNHRRSCILPLFCCAVGLFSGVLGTSLSVTA